MKVLFVDQTGQLGGGELSLLDIVKGTSHTAEVVLFSDGPFRKLLEEIPVPVHLLSAGNAADVRREAGISALLSAIPSFLKLRNKLAEIAKDFDVIYANSQKAFIVSALARRPGQPLIWHLRDMLQAEHFSSLVRLVAVFAGNHAADLIVANSQATLDSLVASGGDREKSIVIYNGISPAPFDAITNQMVDDLRTEFGWQGKFVVGAFGRLSPWKGQHVLLEAIKELPDVHVAIVGDALFGEQEYVDSMHALVQQYKLQDRVHFLGFRRDVPQLMRSVDVIAHTAIAPEPFGRVIVEGMLAQRPVIATRAGGALEILQDNKTGLLVTPGDAAALRQAITQLQTNKGLLQQLVTAGRQCAVDDYSVEKMVSTIDTTIVRFTR
ncbi:MAG: glycosyltransferase [Edaphobacter sp.]|uniref:glycosyltransferase n=1 Tax=Edaphobacter sp. TaxID=1934404 RepID=UPI002395522B|nr:glycosyltransferase [Edaphobacter sp.]MDE1178852.1 glycosyltransferase [Edaphobacter sp.]